MKKSVCFFMFLFVFLGANRSFAELQSWEIDKAHSNFYFSIKHIFSKVHGQFNDFSGTVTFDPENPKESSFVFKIKVDSITTENSKRDKHLLSADFFDENQFSSIVFESKEVSVSADNVYNVAGKFTIKGKSYDLVLPLTLAGIKQHPAKKDFLVAGFNGNLTINRLNYGVGGGKFYKFGVVDKDVDIFISLEVLTKK